MRQRVFIRLIKVSRCPYLHHWRPRSGPQGVIADHGPSWGFPRARHCFGTWPKVFRDLSIDIKQVVGPEGHITSYLVWCSIVEGSVAKCIVLSFRDIFLFTWQPTSSLGGWVPNCVDYLGWSFIAHIS